MRASYLRRALLDFTIFLILIISTQLFFVCLDLYERRITRDKRYGGERLRPTSLFFFIGIILVFMTIQGRLFSIGPSPYSLIDYFGQSFKGLFIGRETEEVLSGKWLFIIVSITFYLSGLYDYLIHRFMSHSKLLWFTHEYHHLPREVFNGMPGLVARPFAVVLVYPNIVLMVITVYMLLYLFNLPLYDIRPIIIIFFFQGLVAMITHSSFARRYKIFHNAMKLFGLTTPQEHILHHSVDIKGNYANLFTLWDRVFGTYVNPEDHDIKHLTLGLPYDQDFLGTITLGKLKFSDKIRERFQINRYANLYKEENKQNTDEEF